MSASRWSWHPSGRVLRSAGSCSITYTCVCVPSWQCRLQHFSVVAGTTNTRSASCTRTRTPVFGQLDLGSPPIPSAKNHTNEDALVTTVHLDGRLVDSVRDGTTRSPGRDTSAGHMKPADVVKYGFNTSEISS